MEEVAIILELFLNFSNFLKKRLHHKYFHVNMPKFLRTPILTNICKWLPLRVFPFMLV